LFRGWHDPIEALIEATDESAILRNDIYDREPLPRWSKNRVTLLGDAAHPMTPDLGQGGCQAIEDAVVLAACLGNSDYVDSALRDYQDRRIPRTSRLVLQSRRIGAMAQWENALLCFVRNAAVRAVLSRLLEGVAEEIARRHFFYTADGLQCRLLSARR
jgi:2-polyprenyl-6-methoxyphenol hydroxylase-like FAD-dependent oxidoreductase